MFEAISKGSASIVTGEIDGFTENGIRLKNGEALDADIVVTATGLKLQLASDIAFTVDGEARDLSQDPELSRNDVQRHAEPVLFVRLHQRLLDAEGGPDRRLSVPAAQPSEEDRGRDRPPRPRARDRGGAVPRFHLGLRPAGARHIAQAGLEEALEALPELRARHVQPQIRLGRGRSDPLPAARRGRGGREPAREMEAA